MSLSAAELASQAAFVSAIETADLATLQKLLPILQQQNPNRFQEEVTGILKEKAKSWAERPLNDIVKIINTINAYHINLTIPILSEQIFIKLLFVQPQLAYGVLQNTLAENKDFKFKEMLNNLTKYFYIPVSRENDPAFAACMELLVKHEIPIPIGDDLLRDNDFIAVMVQGDCAATVFALQNQFSDELLNEMLRFDSIETLKKLYQHWQATNQVKNEISILTQAVRQGAAKGVAFLLTQVKMDERALQDLIQIAVNKGDGKIVLALTQGNIGKSSNYLFAEFNQSVLLTAEHKKKFANFLLKFMRFTSLDTVEKLFTEFLKNQSQESKNTLLAIYQEAKKEFCAVAPFFARYSNPNELTVIQKTYKNSQEQAEDFTKIALADIQYGKKRRELATNLHEQLMSGVTRLKPQKPPFTSLPPSKNKSQAAAAILEQVVKWFDANLALGVRNRNFFLTLRTDKQAGGTPAVGRYQWGVPLIQTVYALSQANDAPKLDTIGGFYRLNYHDPHTNSDLSLNDVTVSYYGQVTAGWAHGKEYTAKTWGRIEDLVEKLCSLNLTKPKEDTEDEVAIYQRQLTDFYESLAELVWLIGNTTPLLRGSGTVAEIISGLVSIFHEHHGLEIPVLKLEFPQLDVLDINFPLSDFKYFFPHFFEPSTIPAFLRKENLADLSASSQITQLYSELNSPEQKKVLIEKINQLQYEYGENMGELANKQVTITFPNLNLNSKESLASSNVSELAKKLSDLEQAHKVVTYLNSIALTNYKLTVHINDPANSFTHIKSMLDYMDNLQKDLHMDHSQSGVGWFFRKKMPTHFAEIKKLKFQEQEPKDVITEVIKILIKAKDEAPLFRDPQMSNLYDKHLKEGLKALGTTEQQFRKDHHIVDKTATINMRAERGFIRR